MASIEFWKMNGSGNDFILVDNTDGVVPEQEMARLARQACRRRESVGADGAIFVVPSERFDFAWRFFNADGSEAEMCGNGGRCVSRFAYLKGIAGENMTFDTLAGPISAEVKGRVVKVLMPAPRGYERDVGLEPMEGWTSADFINTGVPHVVVGVQDLDRVAVTDQGRMVRFHSLFEPAGTNVNFMIQSGPDRMEIRTYERGVEDETLACGTGAMACALAASRRGVVNSPVSVVTRGGEELTIHFTAKGESFEKVWLEGNTSIAYEGVLHDEAL